MLPSRTISLKLRLTGRPHFISAVSPVRPVERALDRRRGRAQADAAWRYRNKSTRLYSILGAHFAALLVLLLSIVAAPAAAQPLATNAGRVTLLGLDRILGDGMSLFYSRGAETEAGFYATEVEAAVRWYRETLGWAGSVAMAALSEADYRRTTAIPYPSPHAEIATGFIIIADHVESHPGFDLWDIDTRAI